MPSEATALPRASATRRATGDDAADGDADADADGEANGELDDDGADRPPDVWRVEEGADGGRDEDAERTTESLRDIVAIHAALPAASAAHVSRMVAPSGVAPPAFAIHPACQ